MKLFFLVLFVLSFHVKATSCIVTDEMQQDSNLKYGDRISIDTKLNESNYYILIKLPDQINNGKLNAVWLFSDSMEEPTFVAPLEIFEEDGQAVSWYEIDAELVRSHFIAVSFGEECGLSVIKEVFYK